ncbi:HNH endonuclease [Rhodococcus sp. 06-418-5]|uniref:HNH endonuclease n=1 Tax=Rhodococcus sp. 06-418-5 TaxID=2022507 RepID=UPI0015C5DC62|nr:HNH endonuclease [Rhodococcus sp. 06-418-5]
MKAINKLRSLKKLDIPPVLAEKKDEWTRRYVAAKLEGRKPLPAPWRNKEIRRVLTKETFERCAFCESELLAVAFGHIEHIEPRVIYPEKVVDWENLTLSCERCNNAKLDYHSEITPLVNPYIDDPEDYLRFIGDLVLPIPGSDRAIMTVRKYGLFRVQLVGLRRARIEHFMLYLDRWVRAVDPVMSETLLDIMIEDFVTGPYQMTIRSLLLEFGVPAGRLKLPIAKS